MTFQRALIAALLAASGVIQARPLHILVTGDMHGWLQPLSVQGETLGGAAEMLAYWKDVEAYRRPDFLVLSAGDVATGPAISTVYQGVPAVEVMNAMGYDASALGNHEFDFGQDQLKALQSLAHFPFLAANVLKGQDGESLVPAFSIIEKQGIKVGIIGLCTRDLKSIAVTQGLRTQDYAGPVRKAAAEARAQGAQVLLVLAHVPLDELEALAGELADLGIPLMMGGHSHELAQAREPKSGTWIVNSGEWWKAYSRIDLELDTASGRAVLQSSRQVWMQQKHAAADPELKALVSRWQAKLDADPAYGRALGYLSAPLPRFWPLANFVCDAWLAMDPQSDVALINDGALRQNLEAGELNRAALTSLLPFNDSMLRMTLSGRQLKKYLPHGQAQMGMAGISRKGKGFILVKTGAPIDPKAAYKVLLNNYMVDTNAALRKADPNPVLVAQDWRDPLEAWLRGHPSSPAQPLEKILDLKPRL